MENRSMPSGKSSQNFFSGQSSPWALWGAGANYLQKTILKQPVQQFLWLCFLLSEEAFHALQPGSGASAHNVNLAIGLFINLSIKLDNAPKDVENADIKKRTDIRDDSKRTKELKKKLDETEKKAPGKREDYGGQLGRNNPASIIITFWENFKLIMTRNEGKRKAALPVRKTSGKTKSKKRLPKK